MKRTRIARAMAVGATCSAALLATTAAHAHKSTTTNTTNTTSLPAMTVKMVQVIDAKTVETTFSNPLAATNTDLSLRVFHAPHLDHKTPHSHEATSVTLLNDGRTARVTLDRGLHPRDRLCDIDTEPRCSTDRLDWTVTRAKDIYGQFVSDHEWRVWAVGSKD